MKKQAKLPLYNKEVNAEPLIYLSKVGLAIYPDNITQFQKKTDKIVEQYDATVPTIADIQPTAKILYFNKDNIAFKIDEEKMIVSIIALKNQKSQIEFTLNKKQQLLMVQEILRRKICEMNFQEKFKILNELGKGATAKVYLVQRKSDKRLFAAKIISISQSSNKQYQTFINQTRILRSLKCKNIVSIQSLYISRKQLICVLQYLDGGTLLEELRKDKIATKKQKLKVVKDLAEGLEHLRQKRIVHRDIKLQNVMIRINKDLTKDYVLTDFGLACWIGQYQLLYEKCGTPGYIAPEILRASKGKIIVSHTSDIFSLGVIYHFVFLLKAVFPYTGNTKQLLITNKKANFSLNSKYHLALFPTQLQLLVRTLELDPLKRPSTKQLLSKQIKQYEAEVLEYQIIKKKKKITEQKNTETEPSRSRIRMGSSIQVIENRNPSLKKNNLSINLKPQTQEKKKNSVEKFVSKVWNKISSSRQKEMKKKQESSQRKKQMRNFLV